MRKSGVPGSTLRWIVSVPEPGPWIVRSLSITSSPLVRMTEPVTAKSMVSPGAALAIASRNESGPLSNGLVTVAARTGPTSRAAPKTKKAGMERLTLSLMKCFSLMNDSLLVTNIKPRRAKHVCDAIPFAVHGPQAPGGYLKIRQGIPREERIHPTRVGIGASKPMHEGAPV